MRRGAPSIRRVHHKLDVGCGECGVVWSSVECGSAPSIRRVHHEPDGQLVPAAGDRRLHTAVAFALNNRRSGFPFRCCLLLLLAISTLMSTSEAHFSVGIVIIVIIRADDDGEMIFVCEAISRGDVQCHQAATSFIRHQKAGRWYRWLLQHPSGTQILDCRGIVPSPLRPSHASQPTRITPLAVFVGVNATRCRHPAVDTWTKGAAA